MPVDPSARAMIPATLQRTLLVLVLLAGQLTGALCGLGHVRDAVASVHGPGDAAAREIEGHDAHPLDGYCHGCLSLAAVAPPPVPLGTPATPERPAGRLDVAAAADVRPVASRHRLARGPPAPS